MMAAKEKGHEVAYVDTLDHSSIAGQPVPGAPQQEQEGAELAVLAYGHCIECTTGPRKDRLRRLGHGLRRRRGVSPPSGDPTCATCIRPDPAIARSPASSRALRSAICSRYRAGPRSRSFARICAIDEVRDRLRIMGGLPKIRTPGAQTGRCARRRATITTCPVWLDRRPTQSHTNLRDRENVDDFVDAKPSIACLAERDRGAASARRNILGAAQGTTTESYERQAHHNR